MSRGPLRLFTILEVDVDADDVALRRAFKRLSTLDDPAVAEGDARAAERHKSVRLAYDVLVDPERRALYLEFGDRSLKDGFDPLAARRAIEKEARDAERRAKAALLLPTAVPRPPAPPSDGASGSAPAGRDWNLTIAIGPRLARGGGKLRLPVTRPVPCPRCEGSGHRDRPCPTCQGQRRVSAQRLEACAACHSLGLTGEFVRCRPCAGTGRRRGRACRACAGAGTVVRRTDCVACQGRGLRVIAFEQPCGACRDTGHAECLRCKGAGSIPVARPLRILVPRKVSAESLYRYAGAGFASQGDAPTDLFVRFVLLARAPAR